MSEDMFQYNKELLQRYVVVVQHTSVGQAGVYHLLDDKLRHIQQVTALYGLGVSSWKKLNHWILFHPLPRNCKGFASG